MTITDQALKRLETGLTLGWHSNPMLRARAVEIIESLAKQLEAKGDLTEEYRRGFKDGVQSAGEMIVSQREDLEKQIDTLCEEFGKQTKPQPIGSAEVLNFGGHRITLKDMICKVDFKRQYMQEPKFVPNCDTCKWSDYCGRDENCKSSKYLEDRYEYRGY